MDKKVEKENAEKFNKAAMVAGKVFSSKNGNVETKDLKEIADEFGVKIEELFAVAEYDYRVWQSVKKADKIIKDIADEFGVEWGDLVIGIEAHWYGLSENLIYDACGDKVWQAVHEVVYDADISNSDWFDSSMSLEFDIDMDDLIRGLITHWYEAIELYDSPVKKSLQPFLKYDDEE